MGCDSVVTLHLTVNNSTHDNYYQDACDNYTWHNIAYNTSGVYTYNYINSVGCPSTDTLHLNISLHDDTSYHVAACDSYRWNGHNYTATGIYTFDHSSPASSCSGICGAQCFGM